MKGIVTHILILLIKAISAFTLFYFTGAAVAAANDIESGDHACTGATTNLVDSLTGASGEATLSGVAGGLIVLDLVFHVLNGVKGTAWGWWDTVDKLQHGLEFAFLALTASVLHTLDLSDNGGGLQALYVGAGCGSDYTAVLSDGLLLVGVSFLATLVQFLILRVKVLGPFGLQKHFDHITNDKCEE